MYLFKNVRRVSTGIVADVSRDFEALFLHVSLFHALGASHQEALLGMYLYVHTYIFFYIHCRLGQNGGGPPMLIPCTTGHPLLFTTVGSYGLWDDFGDNIIEENNKNLWTSNPIITSDTVINEVSQRLLHATLGVIDSQQRPDSRNW